MPVLRTRISEEKTLEWLLEQAEFVEPAAVEPAAEAPAAAAEEAAPAAAEPAAAAEAAPKAAPEWKKSWKKAELLAVAKECGLSVNTKSTKAQIIEALEAYGS